MHTRTDAQNLSQKCIENEGVKHENELRNTKTRYSSISNTICMRLRINETIRAHKHQMEMEVGKLKRTKKRNIPETIENT